MKRLRKFELAKFVGFARLAAVLLLCLSVLLPSLGAKQLHGRSGTVVGNEGPEQQAWDMLRTGIKKNHTGERTKAVGALATARKPLGHRRNPLGWKTRNPYNCRFPYEVVRVLVEVVGFYPMSLSAQAT